MHFLVTVALTAGAAAAIIALAGWLMRRVWKHSDLRTRGICAMIIFFFLWLLLGANGLLRVAIYTGMGGSALRGKIENGVYYLPARSGN